MYVCGVFVDSKGHLKGYSFKAMFTMLPYSIGKTISYSFAPIVEFVKNKIGKYLRNNSPRNPASLQGVNPQQPKSSDPKMYPATMSTTTVSDRAPTTEELNLITAAFGGKAALAVKGITLDNSNVIISPALAVPAKVKNGILFVNTNILRGPPEQLKVIFEGHELFHLPRKE